MPQKIRTYESEERLGRWKRVKLMFHSEPVRTKSEGEKAVNLNKSIGQDEGY